MNYRVVKIIIESEQGICEQCGSLGELKPFGQTGEYVCTTCQDKNGVVTTLKEKEIIDGCLAMDERVVGGFTLH